jgi:outer membrane protein assembly factor BamA
MLQRLRCFSLFVIFIMALVPVSAHAVFGDGPDTGDSLTLKEIVIEGNSRTDRQLILNEMNLQVGQVFDREMMNQVWIMLEDIGYFAFVDMEFDDSSGDGVVLNVYVEEDMTMAYGPLVRYSRRHKYMLGAWLEETNLRGKGETLRLDLTGLYIQRGEAAWTKPWLLGVRGLDLKLSLLGEKSNFVYRPTDQYLGWGDAEIRWNFLGNLYVSSGLNYGQSKYRDDYYWTDPVSGVSVFHQNGTVSHLATRAVLGFDSRDNPWYPSRGIMAEVQAQHWASDDFNSYTAITGDVRLFAPMPMGKHVLAVRAWGRRTDGRSHLENTLFLGGPETIRGYQFGGLEGDEGYLLSVEYRIPLFMMPISAKGEMVGFGLHAFGDAGDAWYDGLDAQRALQSWGAGAHLNIDRMQLRFEAAKTREGEWVFEFMDHFNF